MKMMKWGKKKPISSSSSPGLSRAHHVSWFSKLTGSSDLKLAKEKKKQDDDEAIQKMSSKSSLSSTKRQNDTHESSKRLQRVSAEKENATTRSANMESNEKFEEIMSSVRKKVRDFQRETMDGDKETVIMTPRIQVNRDRQQRCERRDQKLLEQKPKRPEQNTEVKVKKPARRTGTSNSRETLVAHQWQHLKETKLREVKLKADKQRKSMYLRRELGTKENSKVRVFSPRSSEKCRVKAIEDLKKAKLRAKEQEMENESFAVVKCSSDPQKDFRDSMIEMIMENGINRPEELKELLVCYLRLNTDEYHDMIINVFQQVHNDLLIHATSRLLAYSLCSHLHNSIPSSTRGTNCPGPLAETAGKSESCADCPNQQACATGTAPTGPDPGGVGKSTFSAQLSNYGWSPVYVEPNLGVLSISFTHSESDDEPAIWRGPRKSAQIKEFLKEVDWGDHIDYLVVDTPPGTSDKHITIVQCLLDTGIDGAIIVTTPQEVAMADVRKGVNFCKRIGVNVLGVVENMSGLIQPLSDVKFMKLTTETGSSVDVTQDMISCIRENAPELLDGVFAWSQVFDSSGGGAERMCEEMGVPFLGKVPLDPQLGRAAERGKSCFEGNKCSVSAPALKSIIEKVVASIKMKEDLSGGENKETP
ncbi:hypothetical protein HID58_012339 [Brassica napus]|uniref:OVATE domain-containing protein n=1 Tax=Brassica napus TaxID=3708 RepID=A0ABQ8E0S3_BRANA|nr:hypothetical protein HID58_012339 [Brassica napus]